MIPTKALALALLPAAAWAARGYPRITAKTIVADDGWRLRGVDVSIDHSESATSSARISRIYDTLKLNVIMGHFKPVDDPLDNAAYESAMAEKIDPWVNGCGTNGIYYVVTGDEAGYDPRWDENQIAAYWTKTAKRYAGKPWVLFGIEAVPAAVDSARKYAPKNMILLVNAPGDRAACDKYFKSQPLIFGCGHHANADAGAIQRLASWGYPSLSINARPCFGETEGWEKLGVGWITWVASDKCDDWPGYEASSEASDAYFSVFNSERPHLKPEGLDWVSNGPDGATSRVRAAGHPRASSARAAGPAPAWGAAGLPARDAAGRSVGVTQPPSRRAPR